MARTVRVRAWCERHQCGCHFDVAETHQWLQRGLDGIEWAEMRPDRVSWPIYATDDYGYPARRSGTIIRHTFGDGN